MINVARFVVLGGIVVAAYTRNAGIAAGLGCFLFVLNLTDRPRP